MLTLLPTRTTQPQQDPPGLLVSVRSVEEVDEALAGGAGIVDVKEPNRGTLGRPDAATVSRVIERVAGRAPITVALGELLDAADPMSLPAGVAAVKVGLAGAAGGEWRANFDRLRVRTRVETPVVPVAYADHETALAPPWWEAMEVASRSGWLVLDTHHKGRGSTLDLLGGDRLVEIIAAGAEAGVRVAVAGGLTIDETAAIGRLRPAVVGVRGAACRGGRGGRVSQTLVAQIAAGLGHPASAPSDTTPHPVPE